MQAQIPANARVWIFPDYIGLDRLKKWNALRSDIQFVRTPDNADFVCIYGRLGRITAAEVDPVGNLFFHGKPVWERRINGVRIVALFPWRSD